MKKKKRIRYDRIFLLLVIILVIYVLFYLIFNIKISNIYISGNKYLSDQQIIEIAKLENYPASIKNLSFQIEKRLENNKYIKEVKVKKNKFKIVNIEIVENKPLFYYLYDGKTILLDGTSTDEKFIVPTVINYITDKFYKEFINKMSKLDDQILNRISEIEFKPNEVDDNRFLLSMNDGNYVYININTFEKLNKYLSILESLPDKNGILYLDYGNNFEIIK